MILGYNTNGFAHHRLADAIDIIADRGYGGVALTPDVNHLDPDAAAFYDEAKAVAEQLQSRNLTCVIETGARFVLDARRKHQPTLLSPDEHDRHRRSRFLRLITRLAVPLAAPAVSFWSGTPTSDESFAILMNRLVGECKSLADTASACGTRLAFEPEPGMFIDTMDQFAELHAKVNHPCFGLTLDVGHLVCLGETPVGDHIRRWKDWLWNVHLDDMKPGVHDHLKFGEGVVDFADVFAALKEIGFDGMASVELSRHSHDAVATATHSHAFLDPLASGVRSTTT
jgi:sugar phosphate isomerase/epimerase